MWKLLILSLVQASLLAGGQVTLKISLEKFPPFAWTWDFFKTVFTTWQFALCGLCFASAGLMWMYILKNFPFSSAYPLSSLSYVMGMLAAVFIFHEVVPFSRWIGLLLILAGAYLIVK